jgi:hypothetical protein
MTEYEIPILFSSNPADGAQNVSSGPLDAGSQFYVNLEHPIEVPRNAINCTVETQKATIWWVIPNIITNVNDQFYLEHATINYQATIPQGLYDLNGLQAAMEREITAVGAPAGLFNLIADDATQKVNIRLNQAGTQIDFTQSDTFRVVLGFNSQLVPPAPSVGVYNQLGDTEAKFNVVDSFLIHSDIVPRGIRTNGSFANIIDEVLIDVPPGSQIVQKNFVPTRVPANNLIGTKLKSVKMWLTDQSNNLVNTSGEFWTALVVIRYSMK